MRKFETYMMIGAAALGLAAGCASPRTDSAFAKYDDAKEIEIVELARTSQSWDGAELPVYPFGKPELVVRRYVFPRGSKLGWHHHPVMNYGILQQGELTIIGLDGKETTVKTWKGLVAETAAGAPATADGLSAPMPGGFFQV